MCRGWEGGGGSSGESLLGAVFTSNVSSGLLDGALRDKCRILGVTRLQGLFQFLGCMDESEGSGNRVGVVREKQKHKVQDQYCAWQPRATPNAVVLLCSVIFLGTA